MKIDRKQQIMIGVSVLVVILLGAWLVSRGGGGLSFTGSSGSDAESAGPKKLFKYIPVLSAVDREYYTDAYFNGCVTPKLQGCVSAHLKDNKSTITNSFVDTMKILVDLPENENFDNCLSDTIRNCGDLAVKNRIEKSSDASACDTYEDPAIKQSCYNESYPKIAIEKDNPAVCNSLTDPTIAKSCLDSYNSAKSISTREISWCDRMSVDYMQASCRSAFYSGVAKATKDISFCRKTTSKDLVASCASDYVRNAGFTELSQCKIVDDFSDVFDAPRMKDMAHDQCVDGIIRKIVTNFPTENIPADMVATYKSACSGYSLDDRKRGCLDFIETRLKSQAMMAEATKAAAKVAESVPAPATGTGTPETLSTPNTQTLPKK